MNKVRMGLFALLMSLMAFVVSLACLFMIMEHKHTAKPEPQKFTIFQEATPSRGDFIREITNRKFIGTFTLSYYCTEKYPHICGSGRGITASGTQVTAGRSVAVDPHVIALGTHLIIEGHKYIAEDTGGAIKSNRIDIAVSTHDEALQLGIKRDVKVYVLEEGDTDE